MLSTGPQSLAKPERMVPGRWEGTAIHGCQKKDIPVEEMNPLTWLEGEKMVLTPILEATVCHRVSLGDSIE